nr:hypothetical protein [bacterium]
ASGADADAARASADPAGAGAAGPAGWRGAALRRPGAGLGFRSELDEVGARLPGLLPEALAPPGDAGEVVLFVELGYAPHRESRELDLPIFETDDFHDDYDAWSVALHGRYRHGWVGTNRKISYWLRIAVPKLVDEPPPVIGARVSSGTVGGQTRTVLVEDIAGRAERRFATDLDGIMLKTIARALVKFVAKEKVDDKSKLAGLLVNILGAATERADTRGWLTLPHGIALARLSLPPGVHDIRVDLFDALGRSVGEHAITGVQVHSGGWTFLSRRIF